MFSGAALANYAEVVRRAGGLHFNAAFNGTIVKPVQHLLVLFRRNHLFLGNVDSAAHGNKEESVQGVGSDGLCQVEYAGS